MGTEETPILPPLFLGARDDCLRALSGVDGYYTYVLRRPDGRAFYVGKGRGPRVLNHENEARHPNTRKSNSHKLNVIRSIWRSGEAVTYEIDTVYPDEAAAYQREEALISQMRRLHEGGILTNRAPGGGSKAGASPFSKARHAATLGGIPEDDPETAILNRFVLAIGTMRSVVLKPISRFVPQPTQVFPRVTRKATPRQAVALVAAAAANGVMLRPGALISRRVTIEEVDAFVENGVSCDLATSGLAKIIPAPQAADEQFLLDADGCSTVEMLVGAQRLRDLGILE